MLDHPEVHKCLARLPRSFGAVGGDTESHEAGGQRKTNIKCVIVKLSARRGLASPCLGILKSHPYINVHPIRRTKLPP